MDTAASRRYLHADHQGSIIAHSNSSGAGTQKLSYDSFGIPRSTNVDRFGYTGQIWFKELGVVSLQGKLEAVKTGDTSKLTNAGVAVATVAVSATAAKSKGALMSAIDTSLALELLTVCVSWGLWCGTKMYIIIPLTPL